MDVFKLVPPTGFFPQYVKYAMQLTDAPEIYHVMAAISIFSALTCNYTEVVFPSEIHLNPQPGEIILPKPGVKIAYSPTPSWGLIVGPSGDRKTTAINLALGVTKDENGKSLLEDQIQSVGSPESTFDTVSHIPNTFFVYPEGATLFNLFKASYWAQGQGLFPQLYDGEDMHRTLSGQRTKKEPNPQPIPINIIRPRVTLICGVATPHLDTAQSTDWDGGLLGRMMLIYAERKRLDPIAGKRDEEMQAKLYAMLLKIRNDLIGYTGGTFKIGLKADAGQEFIEWSTRVDNSIAKKPPKVRSLFNRLPNHVLRIASHYAVSQTFNAIDKNSMVAAIELGNESIRSIDYIAEILTDDRAVRLTARVREVLAHSRRPYVSFRELMSSLGVSKQALRFPIESLLASGEVKINTSAVNPNQQWLRKITPDENEPKG